MLDIGLGWRSISVANIHPVYTWIEQILFKICSKGVKEASTVSDSRDISPASSDSIMKYAFEVILTYGI